MQVPQNHQKVVVGNNEEKYWEFFIYLFIFTALSSWNSRRAIFSLNLQGP